MNPSLNLDFKKTPLMKEVLSLNMTDSTNTAVFSYTLTQSLSVLTLQQEETGFSVAMKIEKGSPLRVTSFVLHQDETLEAVSAAL